MSDYKYLAHHGIKGMEWGVRRWQDYAGRLTAAGRERYGVGMARAKNKLVGSVERNLHNASVQLRKKSSEIRRSSFGRGVRGSSQELARRYAPQIKSAKAKASRARSYIGAVRDSMDPRFKSGIEGSARELKRRFKSIPAVKSRDLVGQYYKRKEKASRSVARAREWMNRDAQWRYRTMKIDAIMGVMDKRMDALSSLLDASVQVHDLMDWRERK